MRALGIDLAAQDRQTATCVVDFRDGVASVGVPVVGVDDDALLGSILAVDVVGIDAPFGWPDAAVEALSAYHAEGRWLAGESPALMWRLTDERTRDLTGRWPLSVSSDRIAVPAWRCARLLTAASDGAPVERHGGRIVEAYPGGALSCWGFDRRGYKGREGTTVRAALVDDLVRRSGGRLEMSQAARYECVAGDHALDAMLCALVARAAALGRTHEPRPGEIERARREGWIELPVEGSFEGLASG